MIQHGGATGKGGGSRPGSYDGVFQFWLGLVVGLVGSAIIGCTLAWWNGASPFITAHETLVAGFLAVVAAWIPVLGIAFQTRETSRIAAQERLGRATSSRALLSQPLSEIYDYAQRSIKVSQALYGSQEGGLAVPLKEEELLPPLPLAAIAAVGETIQDADYWPARKLAILLEKVQVQRARLSAAMDALYGRLPGHLVLTINLDEYIVDCIELMARCDGAFAFARFTSEEVDVPDPEMMVSAAHQARVLEQSYPGVYEKIRFRRGAFRAESHFR